LCAFFPLPALGSDHLAIYPIEKLGYSEGVYSPDPTGSGRPVIAVIGGGASGTLTAIHVLRLVAAGRQPVRIALIDRDGRHGLGQAYATTHPGHLLNSPAGTMSAVAGDLGQLVRWASANGRPPRWRCA
jgi:hypothetical protein